jgi:hypothetical protein
MTRFIHRLGVRIVAALLLVAIGVGIGLWLKRPRLVEEDVRQVVVTTIQRESPASFLVTGELDIAATVSVENTRVLFPDLIPLSLGTTRASVRVPGRVSYGFDVNALRPESIRLAADGVVEVVIPDLQVYAAEPHLDRMEVETSVGWARLHARSGQRAEHTALRHVQEALRRQADAHLESSTQPRLNTAQALTTMLTPPLEAAGLAAPRFRFQIGPELVLESDG